MLRPFRKLRRWLVLRLVFGPLSLPRRLLRWAVRPEPVERELYLRQIAHPAARARAARDHALHYALIGRQLRLIPRFDALSPSFAERSMTGAPRGRALLLDHARGGGSTRWLGLHAGALRAEGWDVVHARRVGRGPPLFLIEDDGGARLFHLVEDEAALIGFLGRTGVTRLVVNHLIDLPPDSGARLGRLAAAIGADYEALLHDYFPACPRVNLIDARGRFCGLAPVEVCRGCLARGPASLRRTDPKLWRARQGAFLAGAHRVTVPSADLAHRLRRAFPDLACHVVPPEPEPGDSLPQRPLPDRDRPLHVAVLGALNRAKGRSVVLRLARLAQRRASPLRITVVGPCERPRALRRAGVELTGRYAEGELKRLLDGIAPDMVLLPAIWPETWSFTLTEALRRGLAVAVFDIGAPADRLRALARGVVLPCALSDDPAGLAEALLALRPPPPPQL